MDRFRHVSPSNLHPRLSRKSGNIGAGLDLRCDSTTSTLFELELQPADCVNAAKKLIVDINR